MGPDVINFIFGLNSTELEFFPAHERRNATNCWHFNIYERENSILGLSEPKKPNFLTFLYLCAFKISGSIELSIKKVL